MALVGSINIAVNANVGKFVRQMTTATGAIKMVRKSAVRTAGILAKMAAMPMRMGWNMLSSIIGGIVRKLKQMVKYAGMAAVAMPVIGVKLAAGFEKQMAMVSTMLTGDNMQFLPGFAKGIRQLSKEMGQSTGTLTGGMYKVLSATVPAAQALDVLAASSRAAIGGMTDTATSAHAIVSIMNSFRGFTKTGADAERIADKLFATVLRGQITYEDLAKNLGSIASMTDIVGVSFDEMLAMVATASRGLDVEKVFTGIRATLSTFLSPAEGAAKAAKKFGLELSASNLSAIGLIGAVRKLSKLTADQQGQIIGNVRAFTALAKVLTDVGGFQEDIALISQNSAGAAQEAFSKMADTTAFKWSQMKQTAGDALRSLGIALLPIVTMIAEELTPAVEKLGEWFEKNQETIQYWARVVWGHVKAVAKAFGRFVKNLHTDFSGTMSGLLDSANAVFKALARLAVVWGVEIGKQLVGALHKEFSAGLKKIVVRSALLANPVGAAAHLASGGKSTEAMTSGYNRQVDWDRRQWRRNEMGDFGNAPNETKQILKQVVARLDKIATNTQGSPVGDVGGGYQ